jgi:hypothetical protein
MKTKVYVGAEVSSKNGRGTITKIITKSTGYVEVTYESGRVRKEMAFNLYDNEGVALRSKPAPREYQPAPAPAPAPQMSVKTIFNEVSGINPQTSTISSIGTFVTDMNQQLADSVYRRVVEHLPADSLAYKIAMSNFKRLSEKQLWVISYELFKNKKYCALLEKENAELQEDIMFHYESRRRRNAARRARKCSAAVS